MRCYNCREYDHFVKDCPNSREERDLEQLQQMLNMEAECYVRQCSLLDDLILNSLYEICLGVLCYISLYALSLHSTFAHLWVPFSLGVSWNKRTSTT